MKTFTKLIMTVLLGITMCFSGAALADRYDRGDSHHNHKPFAAKMYNSPHVYKSRNHGFNRYHEPPRSHYFRPRHPMMNHSYHGSMYRPNNVRLYISDRYFGHYYH